MDSSTSEGIHSHHGSYGVTAETIKQNKVQKKQKKTHNGWYKWRFNSSGKQIIPVQSLYRNIHKITWTRSIQLAIKIMFSKLPRKQQKFIYIDNHIFTSSFTKLRKRTKVSKFSKKSGGVQTKLCINMTVQIDLL